MTDQEFSDWLDGNGGQNKHLDRRALVERIVAAEQQLVAMDAKLLDANPEIARLRDQLALRPKVVELELGAAWGHDEAASAVAGRLLERVLHDARRFAEVVDAVDGLGSRTLTVRLLVVDLRQAVATAGAAFRAGQAVYLGPDGLVRP